MGRSSKTQTQEMQMPQFQQDYLQDVVLPFARRYGRQDFEEYTGQRVADQSGLLGNAQGYYQTVGDISNMTPQEYAAMTRANYNPYQQDVIDASIARSAREREVARVGEQAELAKRRAFGNERRGVYEAERQVGYELGRDQMIADLMRQGYSEAQAATMAQLQQRQGSALAAAGGYTQLGQLEQATEQAKLDAQYEEFMRRQNFPLQQFGVLTGAAGVIPSGYGTTINTQTSRPGFGGYLGALGSFGQGLGAMGMTLPFSDKRLKKNVTPLAQVNGVNYYTWEWNDEAKAIGAGNMPRSGVIADELQKIHPDLVFRGDDGYLRVDYAGLNERQKEFA